jgi:hypothetical protein
LLKAALPNKPLPLAGGLKRRFILSRHRTWRLLAAPFFGSLPS